MSNQRYEHLPHEESNLPEHPPLYQDDWTSSQPISNPDDEITPEASPVRTTHSMDSFSRELEEFEIDEPLERESLFSRAGFATKRFANNFNNNIIHPVTRILDPVYQGYKYLGSQLDSYLSRLGNPLIIKRLLYVFFVTLIIFVITRSTMNRSALSPNGDFFDTHMLFDYIPEVIDSKAMKENLEYLSSMPHLAGTKGDLTLARYVESYFKNNGITSLEFHEVESYLNYGGNSSTSYVKFQDDSFSATLFEMKQDELEYLAFNPDSFDNNDQEIEGHLLYVNYGIESDFERLLQNNVIIKDSIVLMKYGKLPPSLKIELAERYGCKGVLFVSEDQSSYSKEAIQREHVGVTRYAPGDILTPGWASINEYTQRLSWEETKSTVHLPSLPLSWNDASKLIGSLKGNGILLDEKDLKLDDVTEFWTGNVTSDSNKEIIMRNDPSVRDKQSIWNIIGRIDGREQFEKGIFIGAGRDSPCFGTIGSNSGTAILLELSKIFTSLQRKYNWQPMRTIYFLSLDGTDYNLAGSTEWVETRIQQLKKQGYAYIDLSDAVSGEELFIESHPVMREVIQDVLKDVKDPKTGKSLSDSWGGKPIHNPSGTQNYIPFISIAGIPSLEIKFTGKPYPKNSCFDNFENFEANGDKDMTYHSTLVEVLARLIIRLVEDPLIPYNLIEWADNLNHYMDDLQRYANSIEEGGANKLDYRQFRTAVDSFSAVSRQFTEWKKAWSAYIREESGVEPSLLAMNRWSWNNNLSDLEKKLLAHKGIPDRSVYRNLLHGAQYWSPIDNYDYEWNTLPGVRDAVFRKDWRTAQMELNSFANALAVASQEFIQ